MKDTSRAGVFDNKQPAIKGGIQGCLHCGMTHSSLRMNARIIAGFGCAQITKGNEIIYAEQPNTEWEDAPTLMKFENMARKDPNHDWRYLLVLPLREAEYQRHGRNHWVLIRKGRGFA